MSSPSTLDSYSKQDLCTLLGFHAKIYGFRAIGEPDGLLGDMEKLFISYLADQPLPSSHYMTYMFLNYYGAGEKYWGRGSRDISDASVRWPEDRERRASSTSRMKSRKH